MVEIMITPQEQGEGQMVAAKVDQAVAAIREDGFVILENAVSHDHLDLLREKMESDSQQLIATNTWGGAGRVQGHLQQDPPPFAPYVFRDIVANPFAVQVTKGVLGEGLYCPFYSGNVNCPGSGMQPLHADIKPLWPDLKVAHPAASLVVNIALVEVTEENGSTELWPGSHLDPVETWVDEARMAARRDITPPVRANTKKGSLLIRDMRVWHRGMPNYSSSIRHMIAMIHNIHWLQRGQPLKFNKGCEEAFANSDLAWLIDFTGEPIDYLLRSRR